MTQEINVGINLLFEKNFKILVSHHIIKNNSRGVKEIHIKKNQFKKKKN